MVDDRILKILQHSLGVDRFGRGRMYRDHFVTGEDSKDFEICMAAVDRGLMVRRGFSALTGGDWCFLVTDAGRAFVLARSPRPDCKQRARDRYDRFLRLSDVRPDLTFGEFLRREKELCHAK